MESNQSKNEVINNSHSWVVLDEYTECSFQAVNWVMTWHNYPEDVFEQLERYIVPLCKKYVFNKEVGKSGKTRHIQGAFILKKKMRQATIYNLMKCKFYLERIKGKWNDQIYCVKEGGESLTNCKFYQLMKMSYDKLRDNQKLVVDIVAAPVGEFWRKVYWFYESSGGWGKSILCRYFIDCEDAFVIEGKNNDILYGISQYIEKFGRPPPVVVVDIPRVNAGGISYSGIEKLLNGHMFVSKYESAMVRFNPIKVIVFSNHAPIYKKLSLDRWEVYVLGESGVDKVDVNSVIIQDVEEDMNDYDYEF